MAMYWTCRYGANHDCGERCDCEAENMQKKEKKFKKIEIPLATGKTGQMEFDFGKELANGKTVV